MMCRLIDTKPSPQTNAEFMTVGALKYNPRWNLHQDIIQKNKLDYAFFS